MTSDNALLIYNNFDEFYYASVCHVCKIKSEDLKTCKNCRAYRYCTVSHQKLHWPTHKKICRILQNYAIKMKQPCFKIASESWLHVRINMKVVLEQGLNRPLTPAENQIWMFPRACSVCYKTNVEVVFDCSQCPGASYCSLEHQQLHKDVHSKICVPMSQQYKLYCSRLNEDNDVMLNNNLGLQEVSDMFSTSLDCYSNTDVNLLRLGDKLSHVLTIINALSICDFISDSKISHSHLTIHIVGVTYETSNFNRLVCELIFHWIGNLKALHLVFIGPELADQWIPEWEYCSSCQERNIDVLYYFQPTLYSDYCFSAGYKVPNIIAIFNCGFHELNDSEFDLWGGSLPLMLIPNVPLILTSYTYDESVQDLNRIKHIFEESRSLDVIEKCQKNIYHSPIPLRDWINIDEIYFNNYYFSIIQKM